MEEKQVKKEEVKLLMKQNQVKQWTHCRDLIFPAGNVYRKFEMLDMNHTTMVLVFAAIALCVSLTTLIFNWLRNLGGGR